MKSGDGSAGNRDEKKGKEPRGIRNGAEGGGDDLERLPRSLPNRAAAKQAGNEEAEDDQSEGGDELK